MDLELYFTGAPVFDQPQLDSSKSLGGFISSSLIPNATIANLFNNLSSYAIQSNKKEIRVIAIKNNSEATMTGLKAWFSYPDNDDSESIQDDCLFQIGYGDVTASDCGDLTVEKLANIYATPYTVTLHANAVGQANALELPDLVSGGYLGIFIRRILNPDLQAPLSNDELLEILEGTTSIETEEDVNLHFAWDA